MGSSQSMFTVVMMTVVAWRSPSTCLCCIVCMQGTIRVPAPCQYAHKVAYLLGESIHRDPDLSLADKLFYL